jgi:hypothetical protein
MSKLSDTEIIERMAHLDAFRASGMRHTEWVEARGLARWELSGWLTWESRWRARLAGVGAVDSVSTAPAKRVARPATNDQFVQVVRSQALAPFPALPATPHHAEPSVRIEGIGTTGVVLHWPVQSTRDLAVFLHECARLPASSGPTASEPTPSRR